MPAVLLVTIIILVTKDKTFLPPLFCLNCIQYLISVGNTCMVGPIYRTRKLYFKLARELREKIQNAKVSRRACAEGVILIHGVFCKPALSLVQLRNVCTDPRGLITAHLYCSGSSELCSCFQAIKGTSALTDTTCPWGFQKKRKEESWRPEVHI